METGNNISPSLVKKDYNLQPDNDQDLAGNGQKSFVVLTRNGVQILRINSKFKAVSFNSFKFPHCTDDTRWCNFIQAILNSEDFKDTIGNSKISYSVYDNYATLIPNALFRANQKQPDFEFLFGSSNSNSVRSQELQSPESVGVYGIPKDFEHIISEPISNSYLHWVNSLSTTGTCAQLFVTENQMALVIKRNDDLLFNNWFDVKNADDMLYFLMATLETLNILHSEAKITLWGDIDKNDSVHSTIGKFISNISFGNRPKNLEYAYSFKDLPSHKFPFIFSTACA